MKDVHQTFIDIWNTLSTIDFEEEWHNGTGYLNGLAREKITVLARFTDNLNRKGFVIPTTKGCLVVFERYSDGLHGVIVTNSTPDLFSSALKMDAMEIIQKKIHCSLTEEDVRAFASTKYPDTLKHLCEGIIENFKECGWIDAHQKDNKEECAPQGDKSSGKPRLDRFQYGARLLQFKLELGDLQLKMELDRLRAAKIRLYEDEIGKLK